LSLGREKETPGGTIMIGDMPLAKTALGRANVEIALFTGKNVAVPVFVAWLCSKWKRQGEKPISVKMKKLKMVMLVLLGLTSLSVAKSQTLDEIIDKNIAAMGGKEKLLALNSLIMEGTMSLNGQSLPVKIIQVHNKANRFEITVNGMTNYIIQTKDSGWNYFPMQGQTEPEAMPTAVVKESADALDIQSELLNFKEKGHTVDLVGKDDVDGTECFKIRLVTKSGMEQTIFIDPSTYYIIKQVTKTKASGQEQEQTQMLSNYKTFDNGYVFPMALTGVGPGELKITKIDVNPPVDESLFKPSK
jgi:hypothetical protein